MDVVQVLLLPAGCDLVDSREAVLLHIFTVWACTARDTLGLSAERSGTTVAISFPISSISSDLIHLCMARQMPTFQTWDISCAEACPEEF